MAVKRRDFLKLAGVSALGLVAKGGYDLLAPGEAAAEAMAGAKALKGKRWAVAIVLPKLRKNPAAMQAAIKACNTAHNIPQIANPKHEIKWIWQEKFKSALPNQEHYKLAGYQELPLLVMCNHCNNPPCVRVCPTQATFQRPDGIVMMDFHRCIGCRFCMAGCPFGARSFNFFDPRRFPGAKEPTNREFPTRGKGVVEKCNLCAERLAVGKIPACVEACKGGEMAFGDIVDPGSDVRKLLDHNYSVRRKPSLGTNPHVFYIV